MSIGWQKPFRGTQLNRAHPLSKGLAGRWVFNEGSGGLVNDLAGNSNNITLTGTNWGAGGVLDYSATAYGRKASPVNLIGSSEGMTVFINLKASDITSRQSIAQIYNTDGAKRSWLLEIYSASYYQFILSSNGTNIEWYTFNHNLSENVSQTVVFTWIPGTFPKMYIYGEIQGMIASSGAAVSSIHASTAPFDIGRSTYNTSRYLRGSIYDMGIWNRALSPSEVALVTREPYCMFTKLLDIGAMLYTAPVVGGSIINQFQKANLGADLFNGSLI